ncbi:MAG TPA: glycosyltransferase family 4 protein [Allosphingosinicella sp.]|jgi:glycosyltransferase involved in cell wall biosynthesis|nr:glycosyltransferase family 4 protein [Allosphingosinicella sp.]
MRILFVTWDGPQVHYLESLFLPIFAGLRPHGYEFDILQFRWGSAEEEEVVRSACAEAGFGYSAVRIWRWGAPGAFATALVGGLRMRKAVRRFGSDVIMPRSVLPSLVALAGGGPALRPVLLDADGLEIDERIEFAGLKRGGLVHRMLSSIEAAMVRRSSAVLVRTAAAREILAERAGQPGEPAKYTVVANGRDGRVFHPFDDRGRQAVRSELGIAAGAPLVVYVGSFGPKYRTRGVGELALALHALRPDTRLLVLSLAPEQVRSELLDPFPGLADFTTVLRAPFRDVARYLAAADVGTVFITETFSTRTVVPVKTGEYLLCGVPVVGTAAVGDNEAALSEGVFFDDRRGPAEAALWVVDQVLPAREDYRRRARAVGEAHYSLEKSIGAYREALEKLPRPSP